MTRNRYGVAVAFLATAVVLNLPAPAAWRARSAARGAVAPFQNLLGMLVEGWQGLGRKEGVSAPELLAWQERALAAEARAADAVREAAVLRPDNDELRRLLGYRRAQRHALILCRVVGRGDATGWWRTVQLDRGQDAGIGPDLPVLTPRGLVGRTRDVQRDRCEVLLLADAGFRVAGSFPRSGAKGIVRGSPDRAGAPGSRMSAAPLLAEYVSRTADLKPEDSVTTSGQGGVFPAGIPVGTVRRVFLDRSGLYQCAEIEPAENVDDLDYVFVMVTWPDPVSDRWRTP